METMLQPKVTGYRQLSETEVGLMNDGKALAEACGAYIERLRAYPSTGCGASPRIVGDGVPTIDHRWVSIGATQIQQGFMAVIRGIAQPSTF